MKDRGKSVELYNNDLFSDCYYSSSSDLPCKKHPSSSSSVGICAYCLKDRLVKLVCSDCGEQRLSSCSCSDDLSSNVNNADVSGGGGGGGVGSVGRISFLIENEKSNDAPHVHHHHHHKRVGKIRDEKTEEIFVLKRSNSSCVEIKRKNGFWKIGRLFRKSKRDDEKDGVKCEDQKSDLWVVDYMGVSRSRSLCSFRGGGFFGSSEDGADSMAFSGARSSISAARSSSVNGYPPGFDPERKSGFSEAEPRRSGFEGRKSGFSETEPPRKSGFEGRKSNFSETEPRKSGFEGRKSNFSETEQRKSCFEGRKSSFSETEPRKSGFEGRKSNFSETEHRKSGFDSEKRDSNVDASVYNRRVFSLKESYNFSGGEDSGFIDLKFDFSSESSKPDYSGLKMCGLSDSKSAFGSMRYGSSSSDFISNQCGMEDRGLRCSHGGASSCRVSSVGGGGGGGGGDRGGGGIKKSNSSSRRRSFKGWKWIFKHHNGNWISSNARKKDEDVMVNP